MIRVNPYKNLEKALGYRFRKRRWLEMALTHRSYRYEGHPEALDNQRLEFLGDAVLGYLAAEVLYRRHPELEEGELTRRRSLVSSGVALAAVGRRLDLGRYLVMGKGEEGSGGRDRDSNLADAVEAVLGACLLDGGEKGARRMFARLFVPLIEDDSGERRDANPKGVLQEIAQREDGVAPVYRITDQHGPPHARRYAAEVRIGDRVLGRGTGRSKQAAETEAARQALRALEA